MRMRRVAILVTGVLVAGLAAAFAVSGWEQADRVAAVASALTAVGALGMGVWAALPRAQRDTGPDTRPGTPPIGTATAIRTGAATASGPGSTANTGVSGAAATPGPVRANRTGDARASGGGNANSGVDQRPHA